ncbi:MAG: glutamate--tRNA ligase [Bradymonadales bacterium]|nr:MAG: glutamate--tRNA ligase [Bradymonadales bacterium]
MVRTRFAPSPTGFLHLGNARTALFAFLYARHCQGQFILRIEDTDQERLVEGSEEAIYRDLLWLGLEWDEGPQKGGPVGPYRCSERSSLYESYLKKLSKLTRIYRCFATPEELEQERKLQVSQGRPIKYSGRYRQLSDQESQKRADAGEKFVWRMLVDESSDPIVIKDAVRGEVKMSPEVIGDFVLFRSNGVPVFLFANAVDDALMEITHVTRGEDHLSNTFRQVLIYRALGFSEPVFAHLPMIGDSDGGKFSKRAGSLSIENLKNDGYLPSGLVNYLALLGWSPGDTSVTGEKFSMNELIQRFDLERVNKSRALFDFQKLKFLNGQHIQDLSESELAKLVPCQMPEWQDRWSQAIALVKHSAEVLTDFRKVEAYLKEPDYQSDPEVQNLLASEDTQKLLGTVYSATKERMTAEGSSVELVLAEEIKGAGKSLGLKGKALFFPFRAAITGSFTGPELIPLAKLLGAEQVLKRLELAMKRGRPNSATA